jgi:hypothetical protein
VGGAAHVGAASANKQAAAQAPQAAPAAPAPVAAAPAPAAPAEDPTMAELEKLGQLHNEGILTDEEFTAAKKKALGI